MNSRLNMTNEQLAAWCRKWQIAEVWLFGSVLRDDFSATSDIDVMVQFDDEARWSLFELSEMKFELQDLVGRNVDLLTLDGVRGMKNPYRRHSILSSAERVFAA